MRVTLPPLLELLELDELELDEDELELELEDELELDELELDDDDELDELEELLEGSSVPPQAARSATELHKHAALATLRLIDQRFLSMDIEFSSLL